MKRNVFLLLLSVIVLTAIPNKTMATPSITGATGVVDGLSVTISGTAFGTKSTPVPQVFDNFDFNDAGRQLDDIITNKACSNYGQWVNKSNDNIPTYTNLNNRPGSILCSYNPLSATTATNHAPMFIDFADSHQSSVLIDFWFSFSFDAHLDGDETGQWQYKIWRFGDGDEVDGQAHFQNLWINRNDGTTYKKFYEIFHNDVTNPNWPSDGDTSLDLDYFKQDGTWQHVIIRIKDTGKADIYINDVRETTDADLTMTTWIAGDEWKRATFGWYLGTESWTNPSGPVPEIWSYWDDIYIDNTWQSVYIGNASTWANCTHREIQIPTAWTDTSITINVNQGSFDTCGTYYLFVVDEDGVPSAGYPVRIVTGAGQPPCTPNNLERLNVTGTTVELQWDTNKEQDLDGYKIYYKTGTSGGGVKANYPNVVDVPKASDENNDDPDVKFRYTVPGLDLSANAYFFVVTAYDNEDPVLESDCSNEVVSLGITGIDAALSMDGSHTIGDPIDFTIYFSEPVTLADNNLQITLDTGAVIDITPPDLQNQDTVDVTYTVSTNENSSDLTVTDIALLPGGTLKNSNDIDCPMILPLGNNLADNRAIVIDTTPPGAPVVSGTTPTNDTTPTWTWTSAPGDEGNGTYRYKLNDPDLDTDATETTATSYTPGAALAQGSHILYVQEVDDFGYWSLSGSFTIIINTTPPGAPFVWGTTPTNDTTPTWSWTSGGGGTGNYRYKLNDPDLDTDATETTATSYTPGTALAQGSHILYVQEMNAGTWSSSGSFTIIIDTTPPGAPVVSGTTPTNDTTPTWTWTSGAGGYGYYRYKLNNPDLTTGAVLTTRRSYTSGTALAQGSYTLYVQAQDAAGNWSSSGGHTIKIDTTAPNAPKITTDGGNGAGENYRTNKSPITLNGTCAADANEIHVNYSTNGVTYNAGQTTWSYSGTLQLGQNTFYVVAIDAAGNSSNLDSITVTYYPPFGDNNPPDPPVLSSPEDGAIGVSLTPTLQTNPFFDPDIRDTHAASQWQGSKTFGDFSGSELVFDVTSATDLTSFNVPDYFLDTGIIYYWRVKFFDNNDAGSDWSVSRSFTTLNVDPGDLNSNGIPDDQEVPDTVDLDGDGISDVDKILDDPDNYKSVNTVDENGQVVGQMGVDTGDDDSVVIVMLSAVNPADLPDEGKPDDLPLGLIGFKLNVTPGAEVQVKIYFSEAASDGAHWYIYNPVGGWLDCTDLGYATFSPDRMSLILRLKDGGFPDFACDADNLVNGVIIDPSGFDISPSKPKRLGGGGGGGGCFIDTSVHD